MTKEEKLLNMLMGDGSSDGEIINARNMLKKMNVKLNVGENNQSEDYIRLFRKHTNLQSEYQTLYSQYNYLYREYNNAMNQKMEVDEKDRYERQLKMLNKKLEDSKVEMTKLSYYLNATFALAVIFGLMFFSSLFIKR